MPSSAHPTSCRRRYRLRSSGVELAERLQGSMRTATHEVAALAWLVALATACGHSAGVSGAGTPLLLATSRLDHHMKRHSAAPASASFESAVTVRTVRVGPSACRIIFTCLTHSF